MDQQLKSYLMLEKEYDYEESIVNLSNDKEITLLEFKGIWGSDEQTRLLYKWEDNELFYELRVVDPHLDNLEMKAADESKYRDIIESIY